MAKNVICLWYDGTAEEAARFYARTFPNSAVTAVHNAPGDFPNGKQGDVLTVEFTVVALRLVKSCASKKKNVLFFKTGPPIVPPN